MSKDDEKITPPEDVTPKSIPDATDIESLWFDPALGDGITNTSYQSIVVGKPKDFFRTVTDPNYRRQGELYTHKVEGEFDEAHYILAPNMRGMIPEATPVTIVTVVYRDGTPRLWPIKHPRPGEKDNRAWVTARAAARAGMERWIKLVWAGSAYQTRDAMPGYAPDPDFSKLPTFEELVRLGFGEAGIIKSTDHPIYRELFGAPSKKPEGGGDDL